MSREPQERDVTLVLAFLNTVDAELGTDLLDDPAGWRAWVQQRGLGEPAGTAEQARSARDALRDTLTGADGGDWPGVTVTARVEGGSPALAAAGAVATILAAAVRLAVSGAWDRLKICPASDCRWAFYDRSRNRSRSWCSMQVCGNRDKARAFRERARQAKD
ncbi:MAG: hypothetical protein GEV09_11710 [Pseudonocardiaceae bacterium]|nr:hypothetical protein [Pseudonocardiaceae bacterium]